MLVMDIILYRVEFLLMYESNLSSDEYPNLPHFLYNYERAHSLGKKH